MRLVFAGTPEFARVALAALHDAGHDIIGVLSQPDRPAGRGMKLTPSPVKVEALARGLPVLQPLTLKEPEIQQTLRELSPDLMVVVAYGLLLPQTVLDLPRLGCLNIHASLLPRWRGAAPIQRAIEAGDRETGITIMRMEAGLDTGPMLLQVPLTIDATDTAQTLHDRLAILGATCIHRALSDFDQLTATPQDDHHATYAAKLFREEGRIDWRQASTIIDRKVRAFNPFPVAHTVYTGETWRLYHTRPVDGHGQPGEILAADSGGLVVACGTGALQIEELQRAGGRRMTVAQFLSGCPLAAGQILDPA